MMRRSITLKAFILLLVIAVSSVLTVRNVSAATGQIYVSPSTSSVQSGANFAVNVRINPGTAVNSVTLTLGWDNSKVKYLSVDTSQSAFGLTLAQSVTANSFSTDRGTNLGSSAVSSDALIVTLNFQALVGSGSSALSLSSVNAYFDGTPSDPTPVNGTVNFTTPPSPAPTPPPSSGGGGGSGGSSGGTKPSGGTSGGTGGTTVPTADTTPPKVDSVLTPDNKLQFKSARVSLTTNEPTQVYVKYGFGDHLNLQTKLSELSKTHDVDLPSTDLIPGTKYSYQVVAKDASGNETSSPVKTFSTKGYTLHVTVLGSDNQPLKHAQVVLHSDTMTVKTDDHGVAVFSNVAPGSHHVNYTPDKKQYSQAVAVDDNVATDKTTGVQTAAIQNVAVQFPVKGSGSTPIFPILTLLGVLVLAAVAFVLRGKIAQTWQHQTATTTSQSASIQPFASTAVPAPGLDSQPGRTGVAPIEHVQGLATPDPGSVVTPQNDGKEGS